MKAQLDQHDELGWLLDLMLDKARTGSHTVRACPKAVERAHARLLRERELLIKARVAGDLVRFRETPDLSKEVDEATEEGHSLDHANLASHYACAIANWNLALDARNDAQRRVAELQAERRELQREVSKWRALHLAKLLADSEVVERWTHWQRRRGYRSFVLADVRIVRLLRHWGEARLSGRIK